MHPILFDLGPATIYTYGVLLATSYLLGLWLAMRRARAWGLDAIASNDPATAVAANTSKRGSNSASVNATASSIPGSQSIITFLAMCGIVDFEYLAYKSQPLGRPRSDARRFHNSSRRRCASVVCRNDGSGRPPDAGPRHRR